MSDCGIGVNRIDREDRASRGADSEQRQYINTAHRELAAEHSDDDVKDLR